MSAPRRGDRRSKYTSPNSSHRTLRADITKLARHCLEPLNPCVDCLVEFSVPARHEREYGEISPNSHLRPICDPDPYDLLIGAIFDALALVNVQPVSCMDTIPHPHDAAPS